MSLHDIRESPEKYLKFINEADEMGKTIGHKLISIDQNQCISEYQVNPKHFNPNKILHGGALFSCMDSAQGAFIHYVLPDDLQYAVTGTATIKYIQPVTQGSIRIKTWIERQEGKKIYVESEAKDQNGHALAQLSEIWIAVRK